MSKAYFIGGPPRVGKTTLTLNVLKERPILASSSDALRYLLKGALPRESAPALHQAGWVPYEPDTKDLLLHNPAKIIEIQNGESEYLWPYILRYVQSNLDDGWDVLVEGVHIIPKLMTQAPKSSQVIFIGNNSVEHKEMILKSTRSNPNDWMREFDDEVISAYGEFIRLFSGYFKFECESYGMRYLEISDKAFETDMARFAKLLLS